MEKINIRGLDFSNITRVEAAALAAAALSKDSVTTVFTPNAEIAYNASRDEEFMKILQSADILLPDGAGIIKASNILGTPLREKVAGVDFGTDVAKICAENGYSVFLLGGKPGVADAAAEKLTERFPGFEIVGTNNGYFDKIGAENDGVIEKINASRADVLYVCLGSPAQEKWANENNEKLKYVKLILCIGGSVDVYAEKAKRAPGFFIKTNTEWLYRLIKEPKRFGRMLAIPKYLRDTRKYKKNKGK